MIEKEITIPEERFKELLLVEKRLLTIRKLCGYVQNGTSDSVTIFQDDATMDWILKTQNKRVYSNDFEAVLDKGYLIVIHQDFMEWVHDSYQGMEREEVLNKYAQTGEFPQDFLDDLDKVNGNKK